MNIAGPCHPDPERLLSFILVSYSKGRKKIDMLLIFDDYKA
ncbi:hypothetical protein MuYL_0759 [Mucilaginibacter xinganensis]|uniref:Uncharacterized protein n=1 Tax=Mucilaginibacter xinganensis TaxID=1234841 RepID=A0A223NRY6_9SPHI|nr:hypothetical protein MuYL_0759 [Mucilaginibacter xinganensis]